MRAIIVTPRSIERVRQPVTNDGGEARKAEDDFVDALGGRIAFERRAHVRVEQRADGWKLGGEVPDDVWGAARRIDTAVAFPFSGQRQFELDLPLQGVQGPFERADDEGVDIPVLKSGRAEMTGIEAGDQALDDVDDDLARGQWRRSATITPLLRRRSVAAKLTRYGGKIEIAVALRAGLAQCGHAARLLASNRPSNRTELR